MCQAWLVRDQLKLETRGARDERAAASPKVPPLPGKWTEQTEAMITAA